MSSPTKGFRSGTKCGTLSRWASLEVNTQGGPIGEIILCELWARMFLDRVPTPTPPARLADVL